MLEESRRPRVIVIGLDGATWDLVQPMVDQGWMPYLARLLREGMRAPLRSTLPPLTAPAWSSFMTGLNPGRHGVFAFQRALNHSLERAFVDATAIRAPLLWEYLSQAGQQVGVLNVPVTYPVRPVHGWLVSGMMTPSEESEFTWPAELAAALRARRYTIDLRILKRERDYHAPERRLALVDDLRRVLLERQAALEEVLLPRGADFLMVMYETPDRMQHYTWRYLEECLGLNGRTPAVRTPVHDAVEATYRALDDCIGRTLAQAAGPDTRVFFVSDHGFGPRHTRVHIDQWLANQGLLRYAGGKAGVRRRLKPYMRALKRLIPRQVLLRGRRAFAVNRIIDWPQTQAYSGVASEFAIYVNLAGREPYGAVPAGDAYAALRRQIKSALQQLTDPRSGQRVVTAVYLREEIYHGPFVDQAPDIVYELAPGYEPTAEVSPGRIFSDVTAEGEGMHQPDGIFLAWGPQIRAGQCAAHVSLPDLAPTVLYALDLPVPGAFDGQILQDIFNPAHLAAHPPQVTEDGGPFTLPDLAAAPALTAADEASLRERLTALGYLS